MVRKVRRIYRELTPDEQARLEQSRAQVEEELPQLIERHRLAKAAAEQDTFSGELRRRIHEGDFSITELARRCGIDPVQLDQFLTGEGTLQSDVIGRLVNVLRLTLTPDPSKVEAKT